MAYLTRQQMIDRFGEDELIQLTDRNEAGVIDDAVLSEAIADAEATIDGYLGGRYRLPLTTVPRALTLIAADLARYYLYDDAAPEQVATRQKDAIRFLEAVGTGRLSLGVDDTGGQAEPNDAAELESGGNVWDRSDTSFI